MFQYKDIKEIIKKEDVLQVNTSDFNGGLCKLIKLTESYIHVGPLSSPDKENFGSISHEALLPLELVTVILKIDLNELKETADE